MKTKLLIVLSLLCNFSFSQSESYQVIPGTKCSIIPPEGFVPASNFAGFQSSTGSSIMVNEMPAPVQALTASFTAENLKTRGMILLSKTAIDFHKSKATLFKVNQQANGTLFVKYILVFGDAKKTVLVNGVYPESSKDQDAAIKKSLLSTVYNEKQDDNPLEAVKFTIDVSPLKLKVAKYLAGTIIYTADGNLPTEKPSLLVGSASAIVPADKLEQYSIARLKQLPNGEQMTIQSASPIEIANFKGYELIAAGKNKQGNAETTYMVMLFDKNEYYIMVGMAAENIAGNVKMFKQIASTFRLK